MADQTPRLGEVEKEVKILSEPTTYQTNSQGHHIPSTLGKSSSPLLYKLCPSITEPKLSSPICPFHNKVRNYSNSMQVVEAQKERSPRVLTKSPMFLESFMMEPQIEIILTE